MFNFLKNLQVSENPKVTRTGVRKDRNPVLADIRVFKTGAVYPSANLVQKYDLSYPVRVKDAEGKWQKPENPGNGLDVIDSRHFNMQGAEFLMVAVVPRTEGKIDLFAQGGYDAETGEPIKSVLEQGSTSFGEYLIQLAKEVYNVDLNDKDFIDFQVSESEQLNEMLKVRNGIYFVPKVVSRGPKKGELSYERRENVQILILTPSDFKEEANGSTYESNADMASEEVSYETSVEELL